MSNARGAVRALGAALAPILLAASQAAADVVVLRNDVRMTGIVSGESDGGLELRVSRDGFVLLDTATVVRIESQDPAANRRLEVSWAEEEALRKRAEEAEARFSRAQEAKGLSLVDGEWLTPRQIDQRLEQERLDEERERRAEEAARAPVVVVVEPPVTEIQTVGMGYAGYFPFGGFAYWGPCRFGHGRFYPQLDARRAFAGVSPVMVNPYITLGDGSLVRWNHR